MRTGFVTPWKVGWVSQEGCRRVATMAYAMAMAVPKVAAITNPTAVDRADRGFEVFCKIMVLYHWRVFFSIPKPQNPIAYRGGAAGWFGLGPGCGGWVSHANPSAVGQPPVRVG